jgi:AhpD family alkylhydroperoxidase
MNQRPSYSGAAPQAYQAMLALEAYAKSTSFEQSLIELVKLRASYINGCAYCVDMHTKDARAAGESEQRLFAVPVWRETRFFSPRERAALAWAEAVTEIGRGGVSDELYREASGQFTASELVELTMVVITINGWNRLAVAFQADVGSYQPKVAMPATRERE